VGGSIFVGLYTTIIHYMSMVFPWLVNFEFSITFFVQLYILIVDDLWININSHFIYPKAAMIVTLLFKSTIFQYFLIG